MFNVFDIAKYVVNWHIKNNMQDKITNLRLQKLLYYVQGFAMEFLGNPAFEEEVRAWKHGTVVENVYHFVKNEGSEHTKAIDITIFESSNIDNLSKELQDLIDNICDVTRNMTTWELVDKNHDDFWKEKIEGNNKIMPKEEIKNHFHTIVMDDFTNHFIHTFKDDLEYLRDA